MQDIENKKQKQRKRIFRANIVGSTQHENIKEQNRKNMKDKRALVICQSNIARFIEKINKGPVFICVVCNRCLYDRSVINFDENSYEIDDAYFSFNYVHSFDGQLYICLTCHRTLKCRVIPDISVCNNLSVSVFSDDFPPLNRLEKLIIAKRMLFKKIVIMPKGQSPKLNGSICNIPVECKDICNVLPRGMDNNGVVLVKLKRKLCYKGHIIFEPVRPDVIVSVLDYLKEHNPLYSNITIDSNCSNVNFSPDNSENKESDYCQSELFHNLRKPKTP